MRACAGCCRPSPTTTRGSGWCGRPARWPRRERAPTTAVVVFSSTPYATHESSRAAGAERFVEKGTDLDLLLDVVVEAAEERRRVLRTMTEPALGC